MNEELMAVVTIDDTNVGGDVPIFFAKTQEEQAQIAQTLAKVLRAMVHDLGNGVYIIVKH
ncbi:MAG: capping complex subunit for YIEGIA [Bacillota bacterium]